jgi:hypothetical protein
LESAANVSGLEGKRTGVRGKTGCLDHGVLLIVAAQIATAEQRK